MLILIAIHVSKMVASNVYLNQLGNMVCAAILILDRLVLFAYLKSIWFIAHQKI